MYKKFSKKETREWYDSFPHRPSHSVFDAHSWLSRYLMRETFLPISKITYGNVYFQPDEYNQINLNLIEGGVFGTPSYDDPTSEDNKRESSRLFAKVLRGIHENDRKFKALAVVDREIYKMTNNDIHEDDKCECGEDDSLHVFYPWLNGGVYICEACKNYAFDWVAKQYGPVTKKTLPGLQQAMDDFGEFHPDLVDLVVAWYGDQLYRYE